MQTRFLLATVLLGALGQSSLLAVDPPPAPLVTTITVSNTQRKVSWTPYPHAQQYNLLSATNVAGPYGPALPGANSGYSWTGTNSRPREYYRLQTVPVDSNKLVTAQMLNRMAYGPTPDELERVLAMGPDAYIAEQLAPENLPEPGDSVFASVVTNANPFAPVFTPTNGWVFVTNIGTLSSNRLYMYLLAAGEGYIDDVRLVAGTEAGVGPNFLVNGDFELPLSNGWAVAANHIASEVTNNPACSGTNSLHMRANAAGSTLSSSISQFFPIAISNGAPAELTNGQVCTLSYRYLPASNYASVTLRLSGNGVSSTGGPLAPPKPATWVYFTMTGPGTTSGSSPTPTIYLYLSQAGIREGWVDDMKLVAGTVPEAGANLLVNGSFEQPLTTGWTVSSNLSGSEITTNISRSGVSSLHLVSTSAGSTLESSIYQTNLPLTVNSIYTLSFWYLLTPEGALLDSDDFTARLGGSGINRVSTAPIVNLETRDGSLSDLRGWFCRNAVESKRQLLEVLSQFLENHFVTQYSKLQEYMANNNNNTPRAGILAADLEYREMKKWRQKLLDPLCTFRDLSLISAESLAMIIYLDTVGSKGNGSNIANENYARELLELFCNGVDNGYDQQDIIQLSRCWTGWSGQIVDEANINNPFAPKTTLPIVPGSTVNSNLAGVWTFNYKQADHYTGAKVLFPATNHVVPMRFATASPLAGQTYQLNIPARTGTNGIQDGYQVIDYLADLPFTQEYISVKLCRLFVHDDFEHNVYDYNSPNLSDEGKLIKQCMLTWNAGSPKGQIRQVLKTIFDSELFRMHAGSLQKIKTPFEFVASSIRSMRAVKADGTYTATTSGGTSSFQDPMNRMGTMLLFDRDAPDGYPETAPFWINAGSLAERLRYVQSLLHSSSGRPSDAGSSTTDPVALLQRKITDSAQWRNAGAVADFFLGILYPAEGAANLNLYRQSAMNFLNTADDGVTASLFSGLTVSATAGSTYDTRVRGMVAMLMTFQRFQEQ